MEELMIYTVYSIITLLYGSIFTLLFLDVEMTKRRNIISFSLFALVILACQGVMVYLGSVDMVVDFYPLAVHLPLFLFCTIYHGKSVLMTASSILMCYFLTSPRYILSEIIVFAVPSLPYADIIGKIIASIILAVPIYKWVVPVMKKSFKRSREDVMHFFVPLILVYTLSYLLYVYTDLLVTNGVVMMEIIFTSFFLIIFQYLQKYFITIDDVIEKENRNNILVLSADALKKQLDVLNESNEQTRILRHDIRHYATMIRQYAQQGDIERVIGISEEIEAKNTAIMVKNYCANTWLNLLLNNYLSQLGNLGIAPVLDISVPEKININDMDLCVVLGNVLDNAARSISSCKEAVRCSVILKYEPGRLYLEVQNSCESPVSFQEGIPLSIRDGHGYGCKSVVYIAEKYHGICSFELQENIFTTQVVLHEE